MDGYVCLWVEGWITHLYPEDSYFFTSMFLKGTTTIVWFPTLFCYVNVVVGADNPDFDYFKLRSDYLP